MHSLFHALSSHPGAALPPHPGIGETVIFQLNGLVVVFLALASIWGVLEVSGLVFRRRAATKPAPPPMAVPVPPPVDPGITPETVAIITAAVHTVLGANHRVGVIVPVGTGSDWAREGRRQIFASHQVR